MNVIPINNNYRANGNIRVYNTVPVKSIGFRGLFSKSLQDKFEDGIKALDGNSVFIFSEERLAKRTEYCFNEIADKIDIPILKTYTYIANKEELPNSDLNIAFGIFKKGEKFYIMDLNGIGGGLVAGSNIKDWEKCKFNESEIRELKNKDQIRLYMGVFDKDNVILKFNPPLKSDSSAASSYMQVKNRFEAEDSLKNFNKSTVEIMSRPKDKTKGVKKEYTFADIGGLDEQIEELRKYVVRPLNYPDVYKNIRLNKGILLYGPPRCGKTLLGKALANETKSKFAYVNANEFISSALGSSESNVRKYFNELMQDPAILFIDEFDAIGKKRDGTSNARYDDSVVNQLLGSMSDLEKSYTNSFVIAATNRKDLLDDALLATGRFGLHLEIPMPNETALGQIYDIHAQNQPLDENVSKSALIDLMHGYKFNGSDVAEMFSVGYFNALERLGMNKKMDAKLFRFEDIKNIEVSMEDLLKAISKISTQKTAI